MDGTFTLTGGRKLSLVLARIGQRLQASSSEDIFKLREQSFMQQAIGGHGLAAVELEWRSVEPPALATSFLYDQHARRRVPGIKIELPESVVAPRSDVAQIERGRPRPAHSMRAQRDLVIEENIRILMPLVAGKPGRQQAFFQRSGFRDLNWLTIQPCASSLFRGKQLVTRGIVDHRGHPTCPLPG